MKVLIVSDTHGMEDNFDRALIKESPIDMLIHLGDVADAEDYIRAVADCPVYIVRGNNDYSYDLPDEELIDIGPYKAFLTHGHGYYVSWGEEELIRAAQEKGADIAMYGHTHHPVCHEEGGIYVLNPGSLTLPRQKGRKPSYIVMEVKRGRLKIKMKFLDR